MAETVTKEIAFVGKAMDCDGNCRFVVSEDTYRRLHGNSAHEFELMRRRKAGTTSHPWIVNLANITSAGTWYRVQIKEWKPGEAKDG